MGSGILGMSQDTRELTNREDGWNIEWFSLLVYVLAPAKSYKLGLSSRSARAQRI